MSQQGERPTGHQDDWWGQLYDDSTEDTGPAAAADSLEDRFASALGTVDPQSDPEPEPVPAPRSGAADGPRAPDRPGVRDRPGTQDRPGMRDRDLPPPPEQPPAVPEQGGPPRQRPDAGPRNGAAGSPPASPGNTGLVRQPAPWEAPPVAAPGPATFPPGPTPPGFRAAEPADRAFTEPPPQPPHPPTSPVSPAWTAFAEGDSALLADGSQPDQDEVPDAPAVPRRPPVVDYVGSGPPTYDAEPTALPSADPDELDDLVADTVLDGARYGTSTLRAASVRGDSARYRGEPRRDSMLTARFGSGEQALVLVAMATGARATPGAHRAAAEACQWIGRAVGRSHARLAEDLRAARRGDLKSGLHRLTDRSLGKLRASAAEQGIEPEEYTASLRCLLLPADPECRTRVFFGIGTGGLFRLRDGEWQDIEPRVAEATGEAVVGFGSLPHETPDGDRLTMDLGITTPPSPYEPAPEPPRAPFRFRASVARPGDTLLLCTGGLAEPLRGAPELAEHLTARWSAGQPPGLAAFLADTQVRVKGYADDRTAAAVWEA
ncbi:protein phosphatase 2C domain-containing protein [Streptomyces sp. NPDC005485]|uniref:protein phosphatase 2C domain-containing protein n=1 Tax=Streptomyces sp. NPDC005485 TaxID=3155591 RepID=UPI0033BF4821